MLRAHARHIQRLGRRVVDDIIQIGRRLHDAKRRAGHGQFLCWLGAEFGWSERTAERFMSVHALAGKIDNLADLELPISALYLLAAPSVPDQALWQAAARAGMGAGLSIADVKVIIANSPRASPLRHRIHLAKQILREVQDDSSIGTAEQIIDRRLAEYQRDGHDCASVKRVLWFQCAEATGRREDRIYQLKREIEILDRVSNHVGFPRG